MQVLSAFFSQHTATALAVLFAAALLESMPVIGTVIPGSSIIVAAGDLIGLQALKPWAVAAAGVIGAVLGDGFSFWLGHRYLEALRSWWPLKAHPELLARGQGVFCEARWHERVPRPVPRACTRQRARGRWHVRHAVAQVHDGERTVRSGLVLSALDARCTLWLQLTGAVSSRLLIVLAGVVVVA